MITVKQPAKCGKCCQSNVFFFLFFFFVPIQCTEYIKMFDLAKKANNIIKDTLGMYKGREMGGGGGGGV